VESQDRYTERVERYAVESGRIAMARPILQATVAQGKRKLVLVDARMNDE
jgi:hypothetical protein